ncbi:MAG TPA: hypothetical protein VGK59_10940 [Ohtaekwangia sp.]
MSRVYQVSDLFHTSWEALSTKKHAEVYALMQELSVAKPGSRRYGFLLIAVLAQLNRNPRLVDRINEKQAVDIFNDLSFLREPWYHFPVIESEGMVKPDDKMARHTFDHFIYADNEFSNYTIHRDQKYLRRLLVTLYQKQFDSEAVDELSGKLWAEDYELSLVFFTYAQVREFVMKRCKTLLPPAGKSTAEETTQQARPTGSMWLKLKHRLAETPAFQGYETAGKARMYAALDYLEDLAKNQQEKKK